MKRCRWSSVGLFALGVALFLLLVPCGAAAAGPLITTTSLPNAVQNQPYSTVLLAEGGTPPYTWSGSTFPPGQMTVRPDGTLSGTPTMVGSISIEVSVNDTLGFSDTRSFQLYVVYPFEITTTTLPEAHPGEPLTGYFSAHGGTQPYSWSVLAGALPDNVVLDSNTGDILGTPVALGTSTFTVQVADITGATTSKEFVLHSVDSSTTPEWSALASVSGLDNYGNSVAADAAGNVYAASRINLYKYDPAGSLLWSRNYPGINAIAVSPEGYIFAAKGQLLEKYDSSGNLVWSTMIGMVVNAGSVALDNAGNVYVGTSWNSSSSFDVFKYDANGNQLQRYSFSYPWSQYGADVWVYDIAVDEVGDVYAAGYVSLYQYSHNVLTVKFFGDTGGVAWYKSYGGTGLEDGKGIAVDHEGGVFVTGYSAGGILTLKYDSLGNLIWRQDYQGYGSGTDIAVDALGRIYVTGYDAGWLGNYDYLTIKYDTAGQEMWVERTAVGVSNTAWGITLDSGGHVIVTGLTRRQGQYNSEIATVKYAQADADGDGFAHGVDCSDMNPAINPGATEICDLVDNNCDGIVDEGCQRTITATAGPNGAILPAGAVSVAYGGEQTFTITPNPAYAIADVVIDGTSVGAVPSYRFQNVTADHTINATFKGYAAVTVLKPNGSEFWPSGSTQSITWGAPLTAVKFDIAYSTNNGSSYTSIQKGVTGYSYAWTVPTVNSAQCKVKVTGYNAQGKPAGSDTTDGLFTIQAVRVTAPNGGEVLSAGTDTSIAWATNTVRPVTKVTLSYSTNGGSKWTKIVDLTSNPGAYTWRIPSVGSTQCRIKTDLYNGTVSVGSDTSDANFTVKR